MRRLKKLIAFFQNWLEDDPFTQSGAIAYYAVFSMPGLLIIVMAIAAQFFERAEVEAQIIGHIRDILGAKAAQNISNIVNETQQGSRDTWAMIVGISTLFLGAMGLFLQLQRSLNTVWDVEVKKNAPFWDFIKTRIATLGLILAIGFLLLISLTITTLINLLGAWVAANFSDNLLLLIHGLNLIVSFAIISALFGLIYKILPDAHVMWHAAFKGGVLASLLFFIGEYALTAYFKAVEPQSTFGAAGSIILLMIWVSYSSLILLMGAEFAKSVETSETGKTPRPTSLAKKCEG